MNKYILWVNYSFQLMMRHNHINALPVRNRTVIFLHALHTSPLPAKKPQKTNKTKNK